MRDELFIKRTNAGEALDLWAGITEPYKLRENSPSMYRALGLEHPSQFAIWVEGHG